MEKNYIALVESESNQIYCLQVKGKTFAEAEQKLLLFPLIKQIVQISIMGA